MTDDPDQRRPRRRRVIDRIWVDQGGEEETFDEIAWVADTLDRLLSTEEYYAARPQTDPRNKDRVAAILGSVVQAFMRHPQLRQGRGIEDLETLRYALKGLILGRVHPLVQKTPGLGSGGPATPAEREFRSYALAAARILDESGVENPDEYVADLLYREGYRGAKTRDGFPASTITNWRSKLINSGDEADIDELEGQFMMIRSHPDYWGEADWPLSEARAKDLAREIISHPWMKHLKPIE